jgi:UPF0716 protein FxsA
MSGPAWLFDPNRILKLFFWQLVAALVLLADGGVLVLCADRCGFYAALAMTGATGLGALVIVMNSLFEVMKSLRKKVRAGLYPEAEYCIVIGLIVSGTLLIIPGFVTDSLGVIAYLHPVRRLIGQAVVARHPSWFKELYEYLALQEYS